MNEHKKVTNINWINEGKYLYEIWLNFSKWFLFFFTFTICTICQYFHLCSADDQRNQPEIEANQFAVDMEADKIGTCTKVKN